MDHLPLHQYPNKSHTVAVPAREVTEVKPRPQLVVVLMAGAPRRVEVTPDMAELQLVEVADSRMEVSRHRVDQARADMEVNRHRADQLADSLMAVVLLRAAKDRRAAAREAMEDRQLVARARVDMVVPVRVDLRRRAVMEEQLRLVYNWNDEESEKA